MKRFKIGQIVVALTNPKDKHGQPRTKGCKYSVLDIQYCPKCGEQSINLGVKTNSSNPNVSCVCGNTQPHEGLMWTLSKYFALVDDITEELEEAVANEDYELAALLRDINN